jgi:hypothetical protein
VPYVLAPYLAVCKGSDDAIVLCFAKSFNALQQSSSDFLGAALGVWSFNEM